MAVKVTVYIAAYNYGDYIDKSIESVINQTMSDWELIIINDGSTDNTMEVLAKFQDNPRIKIIDQENKGLNRTNNIALRLALGKYIVRLDADDYLEENALLILSNTLDIKQDIDLVYPDYYLVDQEGKVMEMVRRKKIEEEVQLLDLPAHGACTMYRTHVLRQIGGYIEEFSCQDGYEMWLRFIQKHKPYNVNIPLFYYRQHSGSLTTDQSRILATRREIKSKFIKRTLNGSIPKVLGVIPATRKSIYSKNDPLAMLAGKPLLWYSLIEVEKATSLEKIVVSSEDPKVLEYSRQFSKVIPLKRDKKLTSHTTKMEDLALSILSELHTDFSYAPEAMCVLNVNTPLRKAYHIDWAVNTMKIYDVDTIISVQEEIADFYQHRKFGLTPVRASARMRIERDAIYKANGAITLSNVEVLRNGTLVGKKVSHINMLPEESVKINSDYEFWLAEKIISDLWVNSETDK